MPLEYKILRKKETYKAPISGQEILGSTVMQIFGTISLGNYCTMHSRSNLTLVYLTHLLKCLTQMLHLSQKDLLLQYP